MRQLKIFEVVFIFFGFLSNVYGEGKTSEQIIKAELGFDAYIEIITDALPEIKMNGINLLKQENSVKSARSLGDISLTGGGKYFSNTQYVTMPYSDKGNASGFEINAGLSKRFTTTGTDVSLNASYEKDAYANYSTISSNSTYNPAASIKIKQPLLYNFFGKVDQYSEKVAIMKVNTEKVRLLENNKSILNSYKKLYFQYLFYTNSIKNMEEAVKNARKLRDQVAINLRAGLSEDDDYQRTVASVLSYEQQLQDNITTLKNIGHQLELYIDCSKKIPSIEEFDKYYNISMNKSYYLVPFEKTNSSKIMDLTLKELLYSKGVFENKLFPELNIFGGVTAKTLAKDPTSSITNSTDLDYNVGFEFSYKLGSNEADSNLRNIKIQINSLKHEYDSTVNSYKKTIYKIQESANGIKSLIGLKTLYLQSLNKRFYTERKKYSMGRLGLSYLIDTENSIFSVNTEIFNLKYQIIAYYIDYIDTAK